MDERYQKIEIVGGTDAHIVVNCDVESQPLEDDARYPKCGKLPDSFFAKALVE